MADENGNAGAGTDGSADAGAAAQGQGADAGGDAGQAAQGADASQQGTDWRSGIPEDLRADERFTSFESVGDLAKAYADSPTPLVVPEAADKYEIPEGINLPNLGEAAHALKMTQEQLNGMLAYNQTVNKQTLETMAATREKELGALKEEWGEKWDENIGTAKTVLKQFDTDGAMSKFLNQTRAGDNPVVIKFLQHMGNLLKEDGFLKSTPPNSGGKGKTLAERLYPKQA